jgi:hypothetical protein
MKLEIPDEPEREHFLCAPTVSVRPPTKSCRHRADPICIDGTNNEFHEENAVLFSEFAEYQGLPTRVLPISAAITARWETSK